MIYCQKITQLKQTRIQGLMTMAALTQDPENARPSFIKLRELKQKLAALLAGTPHTLQHLSMGMSGDYEVAIEEGATLIRLGTILVGDLPNP